MLKNVLIGVASAAVMAVGLSSGVMAGGHHGCYGEDCSTGTTSTTPTETTPTLPCDGCTPGQQTIPTPPPAQRCPPGMTPTAGKDGAPGNDECEVPKTPTTPATTTTTVVTPPPVVQTVTVTVPSPPVVVTKTITKFKTRVLVKHHTKVVHKTKTRVVHVYGCKTGYKLYKGKCHFKARGSG